MPFHVNHPLVDELKDQSVTGQVITEEFLHKLIETSHNLPSQVDSHVDFNGIQLCWRQHGSVISMWAEGRSQNDFMIPDYNTLTLQNMIATAVEIPWLEELAMNKEYIVHVDAPNNSLVEHILLRKVGSRLYVTLPYNIPGNWLMPALSVPHCNFYVMLDL